jgi:hypothetical protein
VSITDRDKKIIVILLPLLLVVGYWFMILAPKRKEAGTVSDQLTQAQAKRDNAQSQLSHLLAAKNSFASDYATVIRLGKSVPTNLDMPSLMVQLNEAAQGTGISFWKVDAGQRSSAPATSQPAGGGSGPTAPGAPPAQSAPGKTAQNASNGVNNANATNNSNAATTSSTGGSGTGSTPAGATSSTGGANPSSGTPGLDSVPLNFEFRGNFFNLADFFHRMKRFVRVVNDQIQVSGRLMTIDSVSFDDTQTGFPQIKADVSATVYLSPAAQGVSAGATPQGPATTPASSSSPSSSSTPSSAPTATVTP